MVWSKYPGLNTCIKKISNARGGVGVSSTSCLKIFGLSDSITYMSFYKYKFKSNFKKQKMIFYSNS